MDNEIMKYKEEVGNALDILDTALDEYDELIGAPSKVMNSLECLREFFYKVYYK